MQMSLDGYVAGLSGELDWMVWNWDNELKTYVSELIKSMDTILLGRSMTEGFVSHWANVKANPADPEYAFGKIMIDTPKIVFSKTLKKSTGVNTTLATGNYIDEISNLKKKKGHNIIVYGGASFVSSLVKAKLIDDFHLFINPVVLGNGMTIFKDSERLNLSLVESRAFDCGIVLIHYKPK